MSGGGQKSHLEGEGGFGKTRLLPPLLLLLRLLLLLLLHSDRAHGAGGLIEIGGVRRLPCLQTTSSSRFLRPSALPA